MSRTSIDIDDDLIARVMARYRLRTKREAVHMALRRLDVAPMTDKEARTMQGYGWDGDLDAMRSWTPPDRDSR